MNCLWTAGFGDTFAEYWAVRRDVGMWDISSLVKFRFTGRDALTALDRLTTRRLIDAMPGVVRYGLVLDEKGAMLDEATLFVVSAEEAYLIGNDERAVRTPPRAAHRRPGCRDHERDGHGTGARDPGPAVVRTALPTRGLRPGVAQVVPAHFRTRGPRRCLRASRARGVHRRTGVRVLSHRRRGPRGGPLGRRPRCRRDAHWPGRH